MESFMVGAHGLSNAKSKKNVCSEPSKGVGRCFRQAVIYYFAKFYSMVWYQVPYLVVWYTSFGGVAKIINIYSSREIMCVNSWTRHNADVRLLTRHKPNAISKKPRANNHKYT